ncbi:MAG TPA: glycogen/starch/alpha-glucan phosphorylase [Bacteroidales bacterium]|nr:glycogen/starch/alpha-glucan phosphorylase [Bacteroidales bacterium]
MGNYILPFAICNQYTGKCLKNHVDSIWADQKIWNRMSVLNVARMGKFSSDRSIRDYCDKIWKVKAG